MKWCASAALAVVVVLVLGGCSGSSGGGGNGTTDQQTVTVGTLQVEVASTAGFKTATLTSPGTSDVAFTALYGSKIVRLQEMGYGKIAFARGSDAGREIYAMNSDGSGATRLTSNSAADTQPAWSPDGRRIALSRWDGSDYEIWVMNADGTSQTRLTTNTRNDSFPAWSPDGQRIAFGRADVGNNEIYVMSASGAGQTNLTNSAESDRTPTWSPDGRRIAFARGTGGTSEIYVMNADGSGQAALTSNAIEDVAPAWSPDGSRIVYQSSDGSDWEIRVMNADGSGQTALTDNSVTDWAPAWSPDGRWIVFARGQSTAAEICVMRPDGTEPAPLTADAVQDTYPAWSPAPSAIRTLIGPTGSDSGSNPPFGASKPLVIVGLNADKLVSATTINLSESDWSSLGVTPLTGIGTDLAGVKITGNGLRQVLEYMGRGLAARLWWVQGSSPTTGAVLIFFSGETGRVSSVIAAADTALTTATGTGEVTAEAAGGQIAVRGALGAAYSAADPTRNLVTGTATEVRLDQHTGEVVAVR